MSGRVKSDRSETSVNFSGLLGPRLAWHASERIKRLFMLLFAVEAVCARFNALSVSTLTALSMVREKASHQIDVGLRSSNVEYEDFDETNANVIQLPSTHFARTDAAHYCNLGLTGPWVALSARAATYNDRVLNELIPLAEACAGDTVQLPQRVNIGPDRIIDQLHWALAQHLLGRGPVLTPANLKSYADEATRVLNAYTVQLLAAGKQGVAACCACYLQAYANQPLSDIYQSLRNSLTAECEALKLKTEDYVS